MNERLLGKAIVPSYSDMVQYCEGQGQSFDRFNSWVEQTYSAPSEVKFPYGNSYGWCVSFHKGNKLIYNVFPEIGAFCVMVRRTDRPFEKVYENVSEYAKELIDNKYPCNNGGWIHFRVNSEESYRDIVSIMEA